MTDYTPSATLVAKIKEFEGLRLEAYRDSSGVWTVGYGHTGNVTRGLKVTAEQAGVLLEADLVEASQYVNALSVCHTQGQFDALVDFSFNLGRYALGGSTLLKKISAGRPTAEIQAEFRRWVYARGRKQKGLQKRREWEARRWAE